jgi:hypothetical protein
VERVKKHENIEFNLGIRQKKLLPWDYLVLNWQIARPVHCGDLWRDRNSQVPRVFDLPRVITIEINETCRDSEPAQLPPHFQ